MSEPFQSEILSLTPAAADTATVYITECETDTTTKESTLQPTKKYPVIAWALVKKLHDTGSRTAVEPVFLHNGAPTHETEYRRCYSNVTPEPGEPKITQHIETHSW